MLTLTDTQSLDRYMMDKMPVMVNKVVKVYMVNDNANLS